MADDAGDKVTRGVDPTKDQGEEEGGGIRCCCCMGYVVGVVTKTKLVTLKCECGKRHWTYFRMLHMFLC